MRIENRQTLLKVLAGAVVGLFLLDKMVLTPAFNGWREQGEKIADLQQKVHHDQQLLQRDQQLQARWAEMQRTDLAPEISVAESDAFKGIARWATASRVSITSITPTWRTSDDEYDLYEVRAAVTGTQVSIGRFVYEMETDPLPVRLEDCEWTARDAKGQQLNGALRFTFIRLKTKGGRL